ncbi:exodeoxyribonuclease VII large subunit, partial [uncultured Porphyromonas sp.]|uniref:exodeoxyribonuclease VII large subunit n=1 Tax=uncultured Porphyromonas sp. TaxID=159274 RepID=UPI002613E44B
MSVGASRISLFEDDHEIKAYRLSELLGSVRRALEASFNGYYRIVAEVASINSNASSGHVYLELTETNKSGRKVASTRATMWSGTARSVMQRFCDVTGGYPQVGMELLMTVSVTFHEQYGFSLNIQDIDPNHTLGNLERIRRETIQKLKENGILNLNKEQCTLPTLTQRIAVISSETAAGWGDFRDQMRRSALAGLFHFDLYPATMQGATTTKTVISALDRIYTHAASYDAVVILRGGGSPIDLSAFDDYRLCEYIACFCLPVITAIGHERDFSVADHVANTSVKTPTAAAEFL